MFPVFYRLFCEYGLPRGIRTDNGYRSRPPTSRAVATQRLVVKEQCLYLHKFQSLEEAREIIGEFIGRYNREWLIERLGHRTPTQTRAEALARAA